MTHLHAFISGRVQGVFFRKNTVEQARLLDLTGWVKNLSDGRVEVVAEGPESSLRKLLAWLHEGPNGARVTGVEHEFSDDEEGFDSFRITY